MTDEIEFTYGGLYCEGCREVYCYRTHVVADEADEETFVCPECGQRLQPVRLNRFLDTSPDILSIMQQLDEEADTD